MAARVLVSVLWILPYLVSGFSAPFIFKHAPNLSVGGHIAGTLFIFASAWALLLSFIHDYSMPVRIFLIFVLALEVLFWSWRFYVSVPLKEAHLLGLSGSVWHASLTLLYLCVAVLLLVSEVKRPT